MNKFEEVLRKIKPRKKFLEFNAGITYWYCLSDLVQKFGNWHSDEDFQELLSKYSALNDNYEKEVVRSSKLESQIIDLESQLQQQALPVVPELVGKWIVCVKEKNNNALALLDDDNMPDDVNEWLFFQRNDDNINLILRAWLDGFTVEKPQLFRVCLLDGRHTLTRRDPRKTLPFNYTFLWSYSSELKEMREINKEVDLFTEQEIKSIDERYWQFAVPVEEH